MYTRDVASTSWKMTQFSSASWSNSLTPQKKTQSKFMLHFEYRKLFKPKTFFKIIYRWGWMNVNHWSMAIHCTKHLSNRPMWDGIKQYVNNHHEFIIFYIQWIPKWGCIASFQIPSCNVSEVSCAEASPKEFTLVAIKCFYREIFFLEGKQADPQTMRNNMNKLAERRSDVKKLYLLESVEDVS